MSMFNPTLVYVGNMRRRYSTVTGRIREKVTPVCREKRYLSRNKYDGKNKYPMKVR